MNETGEDLLLRYMAGPKQWRSRHLRRAWVLTLPFSVVLWWPMPIFFVIIAVGVAAAIVYACDAWKGR